MKKIYLLLLVSCLAIQSFATVYYNKPGAAALQTTTNWGTGVLGTGSVPGNFSTPGDIFIVRNGATTAGGSVTMSALWTLGANVKLQIGNDTNVISLNTGTFGLTTVATTTVNVMTGDTLNITATGPASFGTNSLTSAVIYSKATGGVTIAGGTYGKLFLTNTSGIQTAGGNITVAGAFTYASGTGTLAMSTFQFAGAATPFSFNGAAVTTSCLTSPALPTGKDWSAAGTSTVTFVPLTGNQFVPGGTYFNLTMSNTSNTNTVTGGSLTVNGALTTASGAAATLDMGTNNLILGGSATVSLKSILKTSSLTNPALPTGQNWAASASANSQVLFAATTGRQFIPGGTYIKLTASNTTDTNFVLGDITASGIVITNAGGVLNMGTNLLSASSTITNSGTLLTKNTTVAPITSGKTIAGTVCYCAATGGQTIVAGTYSGTLYLGNSSGTDTPGATITPTSLTTTSGGTFDMGSTSKIAGMTGTITNNGLIKSATAVTPFGASAVWGGTGKVVYYAAAGAQSIMGGTYNCKLEIDNNSSTSTALAAITVNDSFITTSGANLAMATFQLIGSGTTKVSSQGSITTSCNVSPAIPDAQSWGGSVTFGKTTGGQFMPGGTYNNLNVNNTSLTNTANGDMVVNGSLVTLGGIMAMGSNKLSGSLTSITIGGTLSTQYTGNPSLPSGKNWLGATGLISFAATSGNQYIPAGTYRSITCGNSSGTDSLLSNIVINTLTTTSTLTTTAGGGLDMGAFALSTTGTGTLTIADNGTMYTQNTTVAPLPSGKTYAGTVVYNAPSAGQTVVGGTYGTLTLNHTSGTDTTSGAVVVNTELDIPANNTLDMTTDVLSGTVSTISNDGTLRTSVLTTASTTPLPTLKVWNGAGKVVYASLTGGQSISVGTYNNKLQLLGTSGTNVLSSAVSITVNDSLITPVGDTMDLNTSALLGTTKPGTNGTILTQNLTATGPIPSGKYWGGTVKYAKTIGGQFVSPGTYNNLTFLNTSNSNTAIGDFVVNNALTTTNGGTLAMSTFQLGGTPSTITHNGTLTTSNTANPAIPSGTWNGTGGVAVVNFNAASGSQFIPNGTYLSLNSSNTSGTNTAVGKLVVSGTFTTTGTGGTLDMGTNAMSAGTIVNPGTTMTQNSSSAPLSTGKNWSGTSNNGTVIYYGTGSQTLVAGNYGNLTVSGTRSTPSIITLGSGIVTDTIVINRNFNMPDSTFNSITSFAASATNTFQYAQNTNGAVAPITYNNLYFSNTGGTKTATGNIVVNNQLILKAIGTIFSLDTFLLTGTLTTVSNVGTISTASTASNPIPSGRNWTGFMKFASLTGGQHVPAGTYTNLVCTNTSGTNTASGNIAITTDFITAAAGGTFDMGTNVLSSTGGAGSLDNVAGTTLMTQNTSSSPLPRNVTVHGTVMYNGTGSQTILNELGYDTLIIGGARVGTPTIKLDDSVVGAAGSIAISKSFFATYTGSVTFVTTGNTVKYQNNVSGSVAPITYGNLYFANTAATKTAAGNIVVRDTLVTSPGGTFDMSTYTLTGFTGPATRILNSGTLTTSSTTNPPFTAGLDWRLSKGQGTVMFGAASGGQVVPAGSYWILSFANTSGTDTAKGSLLIDTMLVTNGGTLRMGSNAMTATGVLLTSGTGTVTTTNTSATPLVGGTTWSQNVDFRKSIGGQTIQSGNYNGGLTNSNTSGTNFIMPSSTVNVAVALTLDAGSVLSDSGNTIALIGYIAGTGTHTGTGKIQMNFDAAGADSISGATLGNLQLNSSNGFYLSGNPTVNGTLTLTSGLLNIGDNNLLLSSSATAVAGSFTTSNMIVTNGAGQVRKGFTGTGSYAFPIGDSGPNYSPITLNVSGGTFGSGAYVGVKVTDSKQPQNANSTDYLTRYWSIATNAITSPVYAVTSATYTPADVVGYASDIAAGRYDGSLPWVKYGSADSVANTLSTTSFTSTQTDVSGITKAPPTISIDSVSAICGDSTATLNSHANGDNTLTYSWSPSTGLSSTTGATVMATPGSVAGNYVYTVTLTDGNGFTSNATVNVSVNPAPDAGTIAGTASVCYNAITALSNSNPGGVWATADTNIARVDSFGNVTGIIAVNFDTTVDISYTVQFNCGSATAHRTVTINALPGVGVFVATNNHQVCIGSSVTYSETHPGGIWSTVDPSIATIDSMTGVLNGITPGSTVISYTVTSDKGCKRARTGGITVNSLPPVPTIDSSSRMACTGNTITLTGTTGAGSHVWTSVDTTIATIDPSTGIVTGQAVGTTTISYAFTHVCTNYTSTTITVNATTTATVTGTAVLCASGATTSLTGLPFGGAWSSNNASRATVDGTGFVTSGTGSGTVTISYVYTNGAGCNSTINTLVTVNPLPTVLSIAGSTTACVGATTALSDPTTGGVWSSSAMGTATVDGSGVVTGVAPGTVRISYTVTGVNGCSKASTLLMTVNAAPVVSPIDPGMGVVCPNATLTLVDTTNAGGTHIWTSSNPSVATVNSSTGAVSGVAAGTATISYNFTTGCTGRAVTVITVNPVITPTVTSTLIVCAASTATLTPTPSGGAFTSQDPAKATVGGSSGEVAGITAGTTVITYAVTNMYGCVGLGLTNVTINAQPSAGTITGASSVCANASTPFTDATTGGVWSSANGAIATVGTDGTVSGASAGTTTISYTVTGVNGCIKAATKSITVSAVPTVAAIVAGSGNVCAAGGTLSLSDATSGTHTWSSDNMSAATVNAVTGLVTGVGTGTATISYSYTNVCIATATTIVTVNSVTTPTVTGTAIVCAGGATTTLTGAPTGGSWSSSATATATVGTSGIVTGGTTPGNVNISYSYTNMAGCTAVTNTIVTVNAQPTVASITGVTSLCANATTSLSDGTTGGTWTSGSMGIATVGTSGIVSGVSAGTAVISYTFTGVNGCSKASTTVVTVNALPTVAAINAAGGVVCPGSTLTLTDATTGTHTWVSANLAVATINASSGVLTGVAGGTVVVSYNYTSGCTGTATTIITVNPATTPTVTGTAAVCASGATTTLTGAPSGGAWSSSATTKATVGSTGIVTGGSSTGTVTISYAYTNGFGCASLTKTTVTVNALPSTTTTSGVSTLCVGSSATLMNSTSGGTWMSSNDSYATVGSTGTVTGAGAGVVVISYTITNGNGCKGISPKTITVNPLASVGSISGPSTLVIGDSITLADGTPGGVWTSSTPAHATINASTGGVKGIAAGSTTISYTISTCGTARATYAVNVTASKPEVMVVAPEASVSLYPNPTSGVFTIKTGVTGTMSVYSLEGKEIARYNVTNLVSEYSMPSGTAAGIYSCKFIGDDGSMAVIKLIYQ